MRRRLSEKASLKGAGLRAESQRVTGTSVGRGSGVFIKGRKVKAGKTTEGLVCFQSILYVSSRE